jgi:5-methylcytosine-specific restriction endonuclease McrA
MWREKNIEKERAKTRNYRAKKKAGGSHTGQEIENLYLAQNGRCFYCHKKVGNNFEVDHIIPISKNGKNTIENLAIACRSCNRRKHNKLPGDFILH